ncbi:MAG: hypothetical protein GY821_13490 [Gammaproteobacteria bacterium]|nr:hypothetical protein [Gammaproteobacteria bacterium]
MPCTKIVVPLILLLLLIQQIYRDATHPYENYATHDLLLYGFLPTILVLLLSIVLNRIFPFSMTIKDG